jgi:hypothetical protein
MRKITTNLSQKKLSKSNHRSEVKVGTQKNASHILTFSLPYQKIYFGQELQLPSESQSFTRIELADNLAHIQQTNSHKCKILLICKREAVESSQRVLVVRHPFHRIGSIHKMNKIDRNSDRHRIHPQFSSPIGIMVVTIT